MSLGFFQRRQYARSSELVRMLADSLDLDRDSWGSGDGYVLCNDRLKVHIWIANRDYGMKLTVWPTKPGLPSELKPTDIERRLLWSLVQRQPVPPPKQFTSERLAAAVRERAAA